LEVTDGGLLSARVKKRCIMSRRSLKVLFSERARALREFRPAPDLSMLKWIVLAVLVAGAAVLVLAR
jgi:hypothetical protein